MEADWIAKAAKELDLPIRPLLADEQTQLLKRLEARFGLQTATETVMAGDDHASLLRSDGWERIADYVGDCACVMFVGHPAQGFAFETGAQLRATLGETPRMEFLVLDKALTYALFANHHDFLLAWGAAKLWLAQFEEKAE